ncbi:MAG: T9SS type A sorting domain-containing protein, partial [candidate division Zixibacteria bacterium]|nr:T9SS type A sorting domain-containing protein [candidate division Zixibacteria bacterium]
LAIYDLAGRRVATPARGDFAAGEHEVTCDLALSPGVYVYRLEAGGNTAAKRLAVVR